jgi:hypothetical protein
VRSCDNSNSAIYPLSTERQNELLQLASTFTSFEGNTKAGRVEFNGTSGLYAAPAEERLIATWAALVVREAESGQTPATLVLEWQLSQNGQCQKVHVTLTGLATAFSCDSEVVVELAQQRLMPEKLAQLYDWYDRLGDVSANDFTFFGEGSATLNDADKQAIERFAEGLFSLLSLNAAADNAAEIEPLAQAAEIRFASWSPDSRSWESDSR